MKIAIRCFALLSMLVLLIQLCACTQHDELKWDNDISIEDAITQLYTDEYLEDFIANRLRVGPVPRLKEMKEYLRIECIRKTYQGYYTVFLSDSGKALLVFYDDSGEYKWYEWDQAFFSTKDEFERTVRVGETVGGDIASEIGGAFWIGGSGYSMTVQVVEGAFKLISHYSMELPNSPAPSTKMVSMGSWANDRVVCEVCDYASNEQLETNESDMFLYYVLQMDKEFLTKNRWKLPENNSETEETFDPFGNGLVVVEAGYNGNGFAATYALRDSDSKQYRIDTVGRRGFSNGDTVVLYAHIGWPFGNIISPSDVEAMGRLKKQCEADLLRKTGMFPSRVFCEYTFSGLPDLVTCVSQLDVKGIESVVNDAICGITQSGESAYDVSAWEPIMISVYPSHNLETQEKCQAFIIVMETEASGVFAVFGTHYVGLYPDGSVKKIYGTDQWLLLSAEGNTLFASMEEVRTVMSTVLPMDGAVSERWLGSSAE